MAAFNPDVPNSKDPSYLGLSKPISEYQGDTSMGVALKGIGNIIDAGLKTTDFLVKEDIQDKVYQAVDLERNAYSSALQYAQNSVNPNRPLNLVDDATKNLPTDLDNLGSYLGNLKSAKDSNKISQTYYYSRLNSHAKSLRAQYPGWRDYIDQQFSSVSGVNPANAELSARMADLNASAQARQSEKTAIERLILQNLEIEQAPQIFEGWKAGNITDQDVIKWVHKRQKQKADFDFRKAEREDAAGNRTDQRIRAESDFDEFGSTTSTNYMENLTLNAKLNGKSIAKIVEEVRTGVTQIKSEEALQMAQLVSEYRDQAFKKMWADVNKREKDGTTWLTKLGGPDKARERINGHLIFFDQLADALKKERFDLAGAAAEFAKAAQSDAKLNIIKDKNIGNFMLTTGVVNDMAGPEFTKDLMIEYLKTDLDPAMKTFVQQQKNKALTQTDIRQTGVPSSKNVQPLTTPFSMRQAIEEAQRGGVTPEKVGAEQSAKVYDEYVKSVELIGKPGVPDPIKLNAMVFAFDPDNRGVLQKFVRDHKDDQGREIPGKHSIFQRMTSPAITKEIFRLGNQDLIRNYVAWAKQSFGIDLFRDELRELDNIQLDKDFKLAWNSDTHQFIYKPMRPDTLAGDLGAVAKGNFGSFPVNVRTEAMVKATVDRLNKGLTNLSNIANEAGEDVNVFLIDFMVRGLGINPTKGPINFSGAAAQAAVHSLMKQKYERVNTDNKKKQ